MRPENRMLSRRVVRTIVPAIVFLLFLVPLSQVSAHSLYIQSTRYAADKGKSLPLFFWGKEIEKSADHRPGRHGFRHNRPG